MAQTDFGALSNAKKIVWSERVWSAGRDASFWMKNGFMGGGTEDTTKPIHLVTELTKDQRGERCIMQLVQDLQGDGVAGDNVLEGREEPLSNDDQVIRIDQLRHGVKSKGRMSEQRTVIKFRAQAKDKLSYWLGNIIDQLFFLTGAGLAYTNLLNRGTRSASSQLPDLDFAADVTAPTANRSFYAGAATSTATLTTAMTMSWDDVVDLRAQAEVKRIKPMRINGKDHYCLVIHPFQARDLKKDADYRAALENAGPRDIKNNPLFSGAIAVVDGVIIYTHNKVPTNFGLTSGVDMWGSGNDVEGAQALLLGAQAMGFARLEAMWEESDQTDYRNKTGMSYGRIFGMVKPVFASIYDNDADADFGIYSMYTAAAQ